MNNSADSPDQNTAEQHADFLRYATERTVPFLELLGVQPISATDGEAIFELKIDERHLRTLGLLHGGVTASLLDTAMGFAAITKAPENFHVVTVQLSINYTAPAWKAETLTTTGTVEHSGRKTAVARGKIVNEKGITIALGTATFMYLPITDSTPTTK